MLRRPDEAHAAFRRSLEVRPQRAGMRAEALFNRSQIWVQRGDLAEAVADLEACPTLARDPATGFPGVEDPEKNQALLDVIEQRLERLKRS